MSTRDDNTGLIQCGCFIFVLLINLIAGGWSVNVLLDFFLNKTIPFLWASIIGLVIGEISIPAAIVVYILHMFNII
jgi:hypothetical protein